MRDWGMTRIDAPSYNARSRKVGCSTTRLVVLGAHAAPRWLMTPNLPTIVVVAINQCRTTPRCCRGDGNTSCRNFNVDVCRLIRWLRNRASAPCRAAPFVLLVLDPPAPRYSPGCCPSPAPLSLPVLSFRWLLPDWAVEMAIWLVDRSVGMTGQ